MSVAKRLIEEQLDEDTPLDEDSDEYWDSQMSDAFDRITDQDAREDERKMNKYADDVVLKAEAVCRTAGILVESALANEVNPETEDARSAAMFDLLHTACENVKGLRAAIILYHQSG